MLANMLNTTVSLQRQSIVKDSFGGRGNQEFLPVVGFQQVPADIQPASSNTQFRYAQRQLLCTHTILLGTDIKATDADRLVQDSTGRIFKVHGYRPPAPADSTAIYQEWPAVADVEEQLLPSTSD